MTTDIRSKRKRTRTLAIPTPPRRIRVEGEYAFRLGDTFSSYEEVTQRLEAHTTESLVFYSIRDSRLVNYANANVSRKIEERLQYYRVRFSCIFGGMWFKSKAKVRRGKTSTRRVDCPAFISLRASKCGTKLEVIHVCNDHTHEISEQAVEKLPQKRRPSHTLLEEIQELLHLNVDKQLIIEYVKMKEGKSILKKFLFNIANQIRMGSTRSTEDQKAILKRIALFALDDGILNAVLGRLYKLDSNSSLSKHDSQQFSQSTIDVFHTNTPSAIDFTNLSPENDLLNTTGGERDYHELLVDRVSVEDQSIQEKHPEAELNPKQEIQWIDNAPMTVVYKDFICADDTSYTCNEFVLEKPKQEVVQVMNPPHSPVSNHSQDLDDKEYFNDLILISPVEGMYPADDEPLVKEECPSRIEEVDDAIETAHEDCVRTIDERPMEVPQVGHAVKRVRVDVKRMKRKHLAKYLAQKTGQVIINCRSCGTNARLIKTQISYLRQKRQKLFYETEILRLEKKKLEAEIEAVKTSGSI